MKTIIVFGILLTVSLLGSVKLFNRLKISSPLSYLFYSGTIYIFFGLLVGENGFNLISDEITGGLEPVINFSLGWVGFIFGFQLELNLLKRVNGTWFLILLSTFFAVFIAIFFFSLLILNHLFPELAAAPGLTVGFAIVLAILLADSSIPFTIWSSKLLKKRTENLQLCVFISSVENVFPILFTGILFSLFRVVPGSGEIVPATAFNFVLSMLSQVTIGFLIGGGLYLLQNQIKGKYEMPTILFGSVFFLAGISLLFSHSLLFTAMVSGAVFSNLTSRNALLIRVLNPTEKPIYLTFLIFLAIKSAHFEINTILFAVVLLLVKYNSRLAAFKLIHKIKPRWPNLSSFYSHLLLPISSIAPAILLNLAIVLPNETTAFILGIFLICFLMAELFAPVGLGIVQRKMLND
jgi:hypothetical protein